ncbi:MAG: response regulator, partial [Firmicutes bacterium]|nr:response regulator [Bacillota bacterium]
YSSLGLNFYNENEKTLALFRVNLTKDIFEEVKGRDLYDTDSIAFTYSESMRQRSRFFPIASEQEKFIKKFDRENLSAGYVEGKSSVSQVLYSIRKDGKSCFVKISASITRHPLTGELVAFITEQECNSEKVKDTLMGKILAKQFDMVCYLVNGQYGVTIGQRGSISRGNVFPVSSNGSYVQYLTNQVFPVLSGTEDEKAAMRKALEIETIEEKLKEVEPYVVNISIEIDGDVYYKQFDFYSIDPDAKFYILLKSDTTEIQKQHIAINDQLKEALEAANQANVAKTAFLSNMSHEIRTPMNAIIGLNKLALSDSDLSDKTRDYLEKIGGSAQHLLGLINDILDMSRIESGRMVLKKEEFHFSEMIEQINTMMNGQCGDKGIKYDCVFTGHVDEYYIGDVMKLKQVLINVLGNAVKFTEPGGTVRFTVERMEGYEGQSNIRFTVSDTGIGMDKDYIPKLFDPFSQENSGGGNKYGSSGLGMAITKNIVDMMNGRIQVESEKGAGTTFAIDIPLRKSEKQHGGVSDIKPQDLKVLLVDDDPIAGRHAALVLEEIGIASDLCYSGAEAVELIKLQAARRENFNLIFMDWKMPDMDGVETTRKIREIIGNETAIIILTAYNWDDVHDEAISAGVDGFIPKPLFAGNVLDELRSTMARKAMNGQEERPKADLAGRRILVAEDNMINYEIISEILKIRDMTVEHAENGQIAVDMFTSNPAGYYDAVLMDLQMPVMDGLTSAETIRSQETDDSKTIPIIALTANAFDEDVQRTIRAGMNAHLSKPVEPEQVYETLEEFIAYSEAEQGGDQNGN